MVDCFGSGGIRSVKGFSIIVNSLYAANAVRINNDNNNDSDRIRILLALGNAGDQRGSEDMKMADKVKRAVNLNNPDMAYIDAANDNSSDVYGDGQIDDSERQLRISEAAQAASVL